MNNKQITPSLIGIKEAVEVTGIGRNRLLELVKIKGFPALIFPRKNTHNSR